MALSMKLNVERKDGVVAAMKVAAATKIFEGGLVKSNAAGFLAPCSTEAGSYFQGVALESMDNSGGANGAVQARVYKTGRFLLKGTGFVAADVGKTVFASDDETVTKTSGAGLQPVGSIDEVVSSTQVWVQIRANVLAAV